MTESPRGAFRNRELMGSKFSRAENYVSKKGGETRCGKREKLAGL